VSSDQKLIAVTRPLLAETMDRLAALGEVELIGPGALGHEHPLLRSARVVVTLPNDPVDAAALERMPNARLLANHAVGYDNVDLEAAARLGIFVSNTPDVLTGATADMTMALLLAAARRLGEGERLARAGGYRGWAVDFMLGQEVHHRRLGIVGYGRIGRAVAQRARGFDMEILFTDADNAAGHGSDRQVDLETLLRESDFVSLHVPLSEATHHLIDAERLELMRPGAILVNTSRGPVVDEAALAAALRRGALAAAALDVYEREPEIHPDLLRLENVVLAPHLGSATRETRLAMGDRVLDSVERVLRGEPPRFLVNAPAQPRLGHTPSLA